MSLPTSPTSFALEFSARQNFEEYKSTQASRFDALVLNDLNPKPRTKPLSYSPSEALAIGANNDPHTMRRPGPSTTTARSSGSAASVPNTRPIPRAAVQVQAPGSATSVLNVRSVPRPAVQVQTQAPAPTVPKSKARPELTIDLSSPDLPDPLSILRMLFIYALLLCYLFILLWLFDLLLKPIVFGIIYKLDELRMIVGDYIS